MRRLLGRAVLAGPLVLAVPLILRPEPRASFEQEQAALDDLVARAQLIFRGTVQRRAAATVLSLPVSERTAVVRVDEVFLAPERFGRLQGQLVTVQLDSAEDARVELEPGQPAVFFTVGWFYEQTVGVREVGRLTLEQAGSDIRRRISRALQDVKDGKMRERLAGAELVVVGKVASVAPASVEREGPPGEHDPLWWEATIAVESVEKGALEDAVVRVYFPSSTDVAWYRAPKFIAGQEGIWILRRTEIRGLAVEGYTALDPLDVRPKSELRRIRALLQARPPE